MNFAKHLFIKDGSESVNGPRKEWGNGTKGDNLSTNHLPPYFLTIPLKEVVLR